MKKTLTIILLVLILAVTPSPRANADSYRNLGIGIGAVAGGVGASLGTYYAIGPWKKIQEGMGDDESDIIIDNKELRVLASVGAGIGGGIIGAAIGGIIGYYIKKEPKITITPVISPNRNGVATYGLGINGRF